MKRRDEFLDFSPPDIGQDEIDEVVDSLRSGWITTGPKAKRFEEDFAAYIDAPAAVAVSSCTAAMQVSLAALGVGPGQRVVTTPLTFTSTVHVIEQVGASPLLVDVDPVTLTISPEKVEQAIHRSNEPVGAILPVHLAGQACDLPALYAIARENGCKVIEDAAHSLPSRHGDHMIGQTRDDLAGHAVCFSFYATKNLTTGEGGMITCSAELAEEARIWSLHGMSRDAFKRYEQGGSWFYEVIRPGFKANMTDLQAAIGIHQLKRLDAMHNRRRDIAKRYSASFAKLDAIEVPVELENTSHAWHLYLMRLNLDVLAIDRNRFIQELTTRNIGTSVHFIPVHLHPYYRERYRYAPDDFPTANAEFQRILSLPVYPRMSDEDVDDVIAAVEDVVASFGR